jgi:hypothetical protein
MQFFDGFSFFLTNENCTKKQNLCNLENSLNIAIMYAREWIKVSKKKTLLNRLKINKLRKKSKKSRKKSTKNFVLSEKVHTFATSTIKDSFLESS